MPHAERSQLLIYLINKLCEYRISVVILARNLTHLVYTHLLVPWMCVPVAYEYKACVVCINK